MPSRENWDASKQAGRVRGRSGGRTLTIDDAYLGGERNGGKSGRGSENKQAFVIAVETDVNLDHPTFAVIEPVRSFDNAAITDWAQRRLVPEAEAFIIAKASEPFIDSWPPVMPIPCSKAKAAGPPPIDGARWINVLLSNLKRSIGGAYHAFKQHKYARRYLAEVPYRFNRRFRLPDFVPPLYVPWSLRPFP